MSDLFRITSAGRAYAWLLGFAAVRVILDYLWIPTYRHIGIWLLTWFNTPVYIFTLFLLIPAISGWMLGRVFNRPPDHVSVLRQSVLVWAVYPAVALVSLILGSSPARSIEWFQYIPTFMVEVNFLPAGMIAVFPILLVFYTRLLTKHSDAHWLSAFVSVLAALFAIYLAYYQYGLMPFFHMWQVFGPVFWFGFSTLIYLVPLGPVVDRLQRAFGGDPALPPNVLLACTILSFGLMGAGLIPVAIRAADSRVVLAPVHARLPGSGVGWNLRFFQLYDETGDLADYGYYLDKAGAGGPLRGVKLFRRAFNGYLLFANVNQVFSARDRLTYEGMFDILVEDSALVFEWNRAGAGGDPFLESFKGTEMIARCTATRSGVAYRCFLLDENLSLDLSRMRPWEGETFLAASGADVSLIAFGYDDYMDGVIALGDDRRPVTRVTRQGWEIAVTMEDGEVGASCTPLAQYETLSGLDPQPVESPVRCELVIRRDGNLPITTTVDGLLEWIGTSQGRLE